MRSNCLLLATISVVLLNVMDVGLAQKGGGGLSVVKKPNGKFAVNWATECKVGVKWTIKCSKCQCSATGVAVECEEMPCQTNKFLPYNAKRVKADQLVCVPDAVHTKCEECYCLEPNQPAQMCLRMLCPPMKN